MKSRERKVLRPGRQISHVVEGFTCQGEDLVLERQLGAGKNASGSFSLRRWTWKRNSVAGDSSWTQDQRGPGLAWPARSSKGLTRNELLSTTERAKDLAKSAISIWEVRFSQNTTPSSPLLYSLQYLKGKGRQKTYGPRPRH